MSVALTEVDTWTASVVVPEDGDARTAASVVTPFQALSNRSLYLKNLVDPLSIAETITPTTLSSGANDYSPTDWSTASLVRIAADADGYALTGLDGSATVVRKLLTNIGSYPIRINHSDASSVAANRVRCPSAENYALLPGQSVQVVRDSVTSEWILISESLTDYEITPTLSGDQDGWAPTGWYTATVVRVNCTAQCSVTGGGFSNLGSKRKTLINVGTEIFTLENENTSSSVSQRFSCPGGADYWLAPGESVQIIYSDTASRWRVIGVNRDPYVYVSAGLSGTYDDFGNSFPIEFATCEILRLNSGTATITGLSSVGIRQRRKLIVNAGSGTLTIGHQDTGSAVSNRIICPTGADEGIAPDYSRWIWYDETTSRWRLI